MMHNRMPRGLAEQVLRIILRTILGLGAIVVVQGLHACGGTDDPSDRRFTVFENREARTGRTIRLNVVVHRAEAPGAREPLFILAGGPGQAASELAPLFLGSGFQELARSRDLVLVDQRGTGASNPLHCPPPAAPEGYFGNLFDPQSVRACRAELEGRADLTRYTTSIAVEDLDQVRSELGYQRIALWGGSYGTRTAMVYMRNHPERVSAAILDGVLLFRPEGPLHYAFNSQQALNRVFADCAADPACATAFPRFQVDFERVLDRFRTGAQAARIRVAGRAEPVTVSYSLGDFGYTIRGMLYDAGQTSRLPMLVTAAAERSELDPFAQAYYDRASSLGRSLAHGLYLSVMCTEEVRPVDNDQVLRWTSGTFLGDYLVRDYEQACALWPRAELPSNFYQPLVSEIPTLLLSGGRDPTTPASDGAEVAREMVNGLHVVFPTQGHGVTDTQCGASIASAFLERGSVNGLDTSCAAAAGSRPAFQIAGS